MALINRNTKTSLEEIQKNALHINQMIYLVVQILNQNFSSMEMVT